jgi:hypothetical protein
MSDSPEGTPRAVRELCDACVQYVHRATHVELDFTADTLPLLDHYLRGVREGDEAIRALVAPAAGAYFGEVVRGLFPARWHSPTDDWSDWRVEFERCFLHFNPVALAHEAILGQEIVEGGAGFGVNLQESETLRDALEVLGTTTEEDYFLLSTRLEVLTVLVDRLMASAAARGETHFNYPSALYRSVLGDEPPELS